MDCSIKLLPQVRPLTLVEREKAPSLKHRKVSVGAKYLLADGTEVSVTSLPERRTANVPVELSDGTTILLMDLLKLRKAPKPKKPKAPAKPRKKKTLDPELHDEILANHDADALPPRDMAEDAKEVLERVENA